MFELVKLLLNKLCLWPLNTSTFRQSTFMLRCFVNLFIESVLLVGTFKYAFEHIEDIDEATEPAFAGFGNNIIIFISSLNIIKYLYFVIYQAFVTSMFIYIWMISKRHSISSTIDQLEFYVNESKNPFVTIVNEFYLFDFLIFVPFFVVFIFINKESK